MYYYDKSKGIRYANGERKFRNRTVTVNGETFDSQGEADRWAVLKIMERAGYIKKLERQKKYELIPHALDENGKVIELACSYVADFVYEQDGKLVVEDFKSEITRKQPEYIIKRKLMLWKHGIRIKEVTND